MNRVSRLKVILAIIAIIPGLIVAPRRCPAQQIGSTTAVADKVIIPPKADNHAGDLWARPVFDPLCPDAAAPATACPALLALAEVAGRGTSAAGGLWLSGDTAQGFRYLQWIVFNQPAGLLKLDSGGKVSFNLEVLAKAAGITSENLACQRERITSFVRSDEGVRLLAEVMNGPYRYLLHVGPTAPTLGGKIRCPTPCNLDNLFDSRINPRRPNRRKLNGELPPAGFDSMISIDPDISWYNLHTGRLMPLPQLTFHELAEAHARLVLGLDYLPQGEKPGAHDVAIDREFRLKEKRPEQQVITPIGYNLKLASSGDWLRLNKQLRGNSKALLHAR